MECEKNALLQFLCLSMIEMLKWLFLCFKMKGFFSFIAIGKITIASKNTSQFHVYCDPISSMLLVDGSFLHCIKYAVCSINSAV